MAGSLSGLKYFRGLEGIQYLDALECNGDESKEGLEAITSRVPRATKRKIHLKKLIKKSA
jgi:hypothetical protein